MALGESKEGRDEVVRGVDKRVIVFADDLINFFCNTFNAGEEEDVEVGVKLTTAKEVVVCWVANGYPMQFMLPQKMLKKMCS